MSQVFVDHKDMQKFYKYSATKLREIGDDDGMSTTEKQERLRENVRLLFTDIFDQSMKADFEQGREMIKQCQGIISNYITKGASGNWFKKLLASMGESPDGYNHASNVSTFAALFAIGIGHRAPEDLAMAGLFHDLGLTAIPGYLQNKLESEIMPEEKELYYLHPEKSVNIVKSKRIIIPADVERAILQHHEKWNGKGWPKQHSGARISEEAQLLSFADQFDYLTSMIEGKKRHTPAQAVEEIGNNGSINPELTGKIRMLIAQGDGKGKRSA
jgi:HD-GYP domain-containing protein (c-di-GMP phosphodiesterase class II)